MASFAFCSLAFHGCDSGGGTTKAPTFTEVYTTFLAGSCTFSSCHAGPAAAGGMDLKSDQATAYANLVSVAANEAPGQLRVAPGSSATSYVIAKVKDPDQGGVITTQMPEFESSDSRVKDLEAWINAGAKDD